MDERTHPGLGQQSERILQVLREEITSGRYNAGDKLPKELSLCERFRVSRPTVRRAVARLVDEGLVKVRRRTGMVVCESPLMMARNRTIAVMGFFNEAQFLDLQRAAIEQGVLLNVFLQSSHGWDPVAERRFLEQLRGHRFRALIAFCSPLEPRNDDALRKLAADGMRVIHVGYFREEFPEQEWLLPDYVAAGYQAAVELLLARYERFAFLAMSTDGPYVGLMRRGFRQALATHGRSDAFASFDFPAFERDRDAAERVRAFLKGVGRSAGLFCRSVRFAEHLRPLLREAGLRVPEEIGLCGVDIEPPGSPAVPVDQFQFDLHGICRRALDEAIRSRQGNLRELVAPRLVKHGTVRHGEKEER